MFETRIVGLKTVSELNKAKHEHWAYARRRHLNQKWLTIQALRKRLEETKLPCVVELTRIAPKKFDYDNLVASFKWIRDACAEEILPGLAIGRADDEDNGITFVYKQEKGTPKEYAVE